MENGLPRRMFRRPERVNTSEILSFTSAIIVVLVTSILYFSGWIYISAWFGFYGIAPSHIEIPTQLILTYGLPAILLFLLLLGSSVLLTQLSKRVFTIKKSRGGRKYETISDVIIFSPIFSILATVLVGMIVWRPDVLVITSPNPGDIHFSLIPSQTTVFRLMVLLSSLLFISAIWFRKPEWLFWVGSLLISLSSILVISFQWGRADAFHKKLTMTGNLEFPQVTLYSEKQLVGLEPFAWDNNVDERFVYDTLELVHNDTNAYYLRTATDREYLSGGIRIFVIPKSSGLVVSIKSELQVKNQVKSQNGTLATRMPNSLPASTPMP